jgi:hypothetical protein
MSKNPGATDGSPDNTLRPQNASDDELTQRLTLAFRSREAMQPDAEAVAAQIEASLALLPGSGRSAAGRRDGQSSTVTTLVRRGRKIAVAGALTSLLAAGATGVAAANPYSDVARGVENVAHAVGIEWSAMPKGYTREQYEAFWGAGYTPEDVDALSDLWKSDATETKARAGQLLLEGRTPPVPPGARHRASTVPSSGATGTQAEYDAFWEAGYTEENLAKLNDLWNTDSLETKARAGKMILNGKTPPVAPSGRR